MTSIQELTDLGLSCPSCGSKDLRAGYHDFQNMDSFICEKCGLRWQEDNNKIEDTIRKLKQATIKDWNDRFIWVMHLARESNKPLKNADSADETSWEKFVKEGLK
jgi:hypothetical protein